MSGDVQTHVRSDVIFVAAETTNPLVLSRLVTPEGWQEVEAISSAVTALSAIAISGLAAFWAWYRDRENLKVFRFGDNAPVQVPDILRTVLQVDGMEGHANIGVTVVNVSLIPSGILGAGFDFGGGEIYWFREPEIWDESFSTEFYQRKASLDETLGKTPVPLGRKRLEWPLQIPAKGRVIIWAGQFDLKIMSEGGVRLENIFGSDAGGVVRPESGKRFVTKASWFGSARRDLKLVLRGMKAPKDERFAFDVWNKHRGYRP